MTQGTDQTAAQPGGRGPAGRIGFTIFMLVLTGLFVWLGTWQWNRLAEKNEAISRIEERATSEPTTLPPVAEWVGFDPEIWDYRPVRIEGTFRHDESVLVFTSLSEARGSFAGPGYWVLAPLDLSGGGTVWVNRGFVPEAASADFVNGGAGPAGLVEVTGLARKSEAVNAFTPGPDFAGRIEWLRNVDRLNAFVDSEGPVAPVYVDAGPGDDGALPQGGETRLQLPNRHLEYAVTWWSLAVLTPLMLLVWWRRK